MKKLVLAVVVSIIFYTLADILIWQRIFEANELWLGIGIYHKGWQMMLYGLMASGAILLLPRWRQSVVFSVSLYTLAHSGLSDVLYYWLDGRAIPELLPWLDEAPLILFSPVTNSNLILGSLAWIGIWIIILNYNKLNIGGH